MENITNFSLNRISWGAIFAGVIVSLALQALFNVLGFGLGFSMFKVDANVLGGIGIGSVLWLTITGIFCMFVSGWVVGRLSSIKLIVEAMLHGLVVWSLATLIVFSSVATTAGIFMNGMANFMGRDMSTTGHTSSPFYNISQPQRSQSDYSNYSKNFPNNTSPTTTETNADNNTPNNSLDNQVTQTQQNAVQDAEKTSNALGAAGILTFFVFSLSAVASIAGVIFGIRRRPV